MDGTIFYFPEMFLNYIEGSGLKIPKDLKNYDPQEYPHYSVFEKLHLGIPIDIYSLHDNAKIIAKLTNDEIKTITLNQLIDKGFCYIGDCANID